MSNVSEELERLIVRRLDGELSEQQSIELDRELLRSPEARACFEEYQRLDRLAVAAISSSVGGFAPASPDRIRGRFQPAARRWWHHWRVVVPAMAASLALFILWQTPPAPVANDHPSNQLAENNANNVIHHPESAGNITGWQKWSGRDVGVFNVSDIAPQRVNRVIDQDYILLRGQDGQLYLINVDHARQFRTDESKQKTAGWRKPI